MHDNFQSANQAVSRPQARMPLEMLLIVLKSDDVEAVLVFRTKPAWAMAITKSRIFELISVNIKTLAIPVTRQLKRPAAIASFLAL